MFRPSASIAVTLLVSASLTLSAMPAAGQSGSDPKVELIKKGMNSVSRTETRLVPTSQTEAVTGEKTLVTSEKRSETQISGPTAVLIKDWETRTYQVPVTTYSLQREESRTTTTTTSDFIRRTTQQVPNGNETRYLLGDKSPNIGLQVAVMPSPLSAAAQKSHFESMTAHQLSFYQLPAFPQSGIELDQKAWDETGSLLIGFDGFSQGQGLGLGMIKALFAFDKDLNFLGGICRSESMGVQTSKVTNATLRQESHRTEIKFTTSTVSPLFPWEKPQINFSDPYVEVWSKLIDTRSIPSFQTVTKDEAYSEISESSSPWAATGKLVRGEGSVSSTTSTERKLVGERLAPNSATSPKKLASSGNDIRRTFSADKSSDKSQAMLSGSKVRQRLGANRVTPSRVTASKGGGAPNNGSSSSWWFPQDPQTPPPLVRFESYLNGN